MALSRIVKKDLSWVVAELRPKEKEVCHVVSYGVDFPGTENSKNLGLES